MDVINDQPQATFKFDTGEIRHTAIVGGEFSNERISIQGYSGLTSELTTGPVAFTSTGAPIVSVYNPPHILIGSGPIQLAGNPLRYNVDTKAGYLMDTANYHDFIILNAGIRYDDYHITAANNTSSQLGGRRHHQLQRQAGGQAGEDRQHLLSPTPPRPIPSATSWTQPRAATAAWRRPRISTQIFGPQKSRSYEVGTKWELIQRHTCWRPRPPSRPT